MRLIPASVISAFLILQYGVMTGLQTSTFRALVMFLLCVAAMCIGRTYDLLSAMSIAAILLLLENPLYLYDVGFLLSFGAVMGIGLVYPCLIYLIPKRMRRNKIVQALLISLSVQLATFPVVLSSFYQISTCGVLLNLVIVPLMTLVLVFGILGGLLGTVELFGVLLLTPCKWILAFYEWISFQAVRVPGSVWITGKPDWWRCVVYYVGLIVMLTVLTTIKQRYKYQKCSYMKAVRLTAVCVMLTISIILVCRNEEEFAITMLSVGQGECIVLHGENIPTTIIDGGSTDVKDVGKYRVIPYLKSNRLQRIDTVFISHTDTDHISGILEILQTPESGIHIDRIILPEVRSDLIDENRVALVGAAGVVGTKVYTMGAGDVFQLEVQGRRLESHSSQEQNSQGQQLEFTCLHPYKDAETGDVNENSMVLLMNYVNLSMLFTGDISSTVEQELLGDVPNCDILKVPHHGSQYSSRTAFLEAVNPELSLISAGRDNSYGHPHQETLERLKQNGIRWLRTDECGAITIETDGTHVWLKTFN